MDIHHVLSVKLFFNYSLSLQYMTFVTDRGMDRKYILKFLIATVYYSKTEQLMHGSIRRCDIPPGIYQGIWILECLMINPHHKLCLNSLCFMSNKQSNAPPSIVLIFFNKISGAVSNQSPAKNNVSKSLTYLKRCPSALSESFQVGGCSEKVGGWESRSICQTSVTSTQNCII